MVVNRLAWRSGALHKLHASVGIVLGVFHRQATVARLIQSDVLDLVAAGVGALLAPVWYVWLGIGLLRGSIGRRVPTHSPAGGMCQVL